MKKLELLPGTTPTGGICDPTNVNIMLSLVAIYNKLQEMKEIMKEEIRNTRG